MSSVFQKPLRACGWWTLNRDKIAKSAADYWVFVLVGFERRSTDFIIIKPSELLTRLNAIHKKGKTIQSYLWVTEKNRCWESRGLRHQEQLAITQGQYANKELHKFNQKYQDTNNYDNWLEKKSYKYAVQYDGKLYPCKYILSQAIGTYIRDFNGGEETNRVFRQLGFLVSPGATRNDILRRHPTICADSARNRRRVPCKQTPPRLRRGNEHCRLAMKQYTAG
jgi:DNA modification methylase